MVGQSESLPINIPTTAFAEPVELMFVDLMLVSKCGKDLPTRPR
jgi:hypothetical protein